MNKCALCRLQASQPWRLKPGLAFVQPSQKQVVTATYRMVLHPSWALLGSGSLVSSPSWWVKRSGIAGITSHIVYLLLPQFPFVTRYPLLTPASRLTSSSWALLLGAGSCSIYPQLWSCPFVKGLMAENYGTDPSHQFPEPRWPPPPAPAAHEAKWAAPLYTVRWPAQSLLLSQPAYPFPGCLWTPASIHCMRVVSRVDRSFQI